MVPIGKVLRNFAAIAHPWITAGYAPIWKCAIAMKRAAIAHTLAMILSTAASACAKNSR
jgi:hypothetical protein